MALILSSNKGFIIINSGMLLIRFFIFAKIFSSLSLLNKVYGTVMNLIWFVHHTCYMILFIINQLEIPEENLDLVIKICFVCGYSVIWTILIGGLLSLVKSLIETVIFLVELVQRLKKFQVKRNQVQQEGGKSKEKQWTQTQRLFSQKN